MITTPQIKRLYALAKLMGGLELDAWLRERYQIYSKRDLTPEQYEDACITMDRIKRGSMRCLAGGSRSRWFSTGRGCRPYAK